MTVTSVEIVWCGRFALALALLGVAGCGNMSNSTTTAPKPGRLIGVRAGMEVPLSLLSQIEAGKARKGQLVPFMVTEDVKNDNGDVVIAKGTIAEGEVTWSRSEGTLSAMVNEPARLEVRLKHTRSSGGWPIPLCTDMDKPDEGYQFTRDNTGKPAERNDVGVDPEVTEAAVQAISEFMETGDSSRLNANTRAREWLIKVSKEPGMEAARSFIDPEAPQKAQATDLERVVKHVRDGSITHLAGGEVMLAVAALQEFGNLAHSVEHSISSRLKGRTIKAYVGTPVKAYVAKDVSAKVVD